jgi:hypothetical protein
MVARMARLLRSIDYGDKGLNAFEMILASDIRFERTNMRDWRLLGLDTLETIPLEHDFGGLYSQMPPERRLGARISNCYLGINPPKVLLLYPEHLKLLYDRFLAANPKGVIEILENQEYSYAPPEYSDADIARLEEERKIFVDLFYTDDDLGYPFARKYLPEAFTPEMLMRMTNDPWLDAFLLRDAIKSGAIPANMDRAAGRWSPEWRAYCDRLICNT